MANFVAVQQDVTERKASEAAFQLRDHALSNLSEVKTFTTDKTCNSRTAQLRKLWLLHVEESYAQHTFPST